MFDRGDESASKKFVEIAEAYECLSNAETRKIYDQHGHEGIEQHKARGGRGGGHDPFDLFSRFFGGSGHFGHSPGARRGPDMEVRVSLSLRDFYSGNEHVFAVDKQQVCEECEGTGSADGTTESCNKCGGQGAILQKHMLAPGIFQQMQMQCDKCNGRGQTIKTPCPVCHGQKVVKRSVTHTLNVEKGLPKGHPVVYENEADESPDWEAGDLIVHVDEIVPAIESQPEHRSDGSFMRRKERDLYWKEVLSLREAWMGDWKREIVHLNGHVVKIGRKRGEVVQPNQVEVIASEGMPVWVQEQERERAGEEEFGNLVIEYTVILPDQISSPMEKDFWSTWEKWRKKSGVDLNKALDRPAASATSHEEL